MRADSHNYRVQQNCPETGQEDPNSRGAGLGTLSQEDIYPPSAAMSRSICVQDGLDKHRAGDQPNPLIGGMLIVITAILFYGAIGALVWHFI